MNYKFNYVQSGIATDRRELSEAKCRLAEGKELLDILGAAAERVFSGMKVVSAQWDKLY